MGLILKPRIGLRLNHSHPLANNLVGCWLMNEGSGNKAYDLSGNENDGTIINALWGGGALNFDGTGDYVDIPNVILTTNYTISILAKLTDSGGANLNIIMGDNTGTTSYAYAMHGTRLRWRGATQANDWLIDTDFYNRLREYTFVVSPTGKPTFYLDGVSQGEDPDSPGNFNFYSIGKGYNNDDYDWQGSIHRVVRFSTALTDGQVADLAANPSAMFEPESIWLLAQEAAVGGTINLSASISAASNTPNAAMSVARALSAAVAAATITPQCALNVARDLVANMQANSTTPDIVLANLIELVASIAVSSQSSAVSLPVARNLAASHAAGALTSEIALSIARDLAASVSAETVTSAIELVIEGLINLAASINAISQTSQPQMAVARELSAQAQAQSISSALILAVLRDLSGAIAAQTQTPDINLPVLRNISTSMAGQTSTSDAALNIIRAISAQISAGTDTSAAVLAVLREMQASMDATTLTSAINLIAGGMGVITDAIIESLTTERVLESLTPNREMDSLTVKRTIEQI